MQLVHWVRFLRIKIIDSKGSNCYRPQRSWAKVIFSQACVCPPGGGGGLPQCMLGYTPQEQTTPGTRPDPPWSRHPPRPDPPSRHPPEQTPPRNRPPGTRPDPHWSRHPPRPDPLDQTPLPPGKQTPPYGQRAAGTHPTGMHSCFTSFCSFAARPSVLSGNLSIRVSETGTLVLDGEFCPYFCMTSMGTFMRHQTISGKEKCSLNDISQWSNDGKSELYYWVLTQQQLRRQFRAWGCSLLDDQK